MKKLYYAYYENEMDVCRFDCVESYLITISSSATKKNFHESFTAETGGDCLGPDDISDDYLDFIIENWDRFEEMSSSDAAERIEHLAEEWELSAEELSYLL